MNPERLNHWLALVANIGVLIGVIFLAVEMQQNTEAINAQSRQAIFSGSQEELFKFLEYPGLTVLLASKDQDMNPEQKVQIDALLGSALRAREFAWRQYNAGILDQLSWDTELEVIAILVGSERTRDWWRQLGEVQFTGEFREIVSEIVKDDPYHPYWEQVLDWK